MEDEARGGGEGETGGFDRSDAGDRAFDNQPPDELDHLHADSRAPAPPGGIPAGAGSAGNGGGDDVADGLEPLSEPPEGKSIVPGNITKRAHLYLRERWLSADGRSSLLACISPTVMHRYDEREGRWRPFGDARALLQDIQRWAMDLWQCKIDDPKGVKIRVYTPANLSTTQCKDIFEAVKTELFCDLEGARREDGSITPERFWFAGTERADQRFRGAALPIAPAWERVLAEGEAEEEGLPRSESLLAFPQGLLDAEAWDRGVLRLLPHTPRLFSTNRFPVDLPLGELREAAKQAAREGQKNAKDLDPAEIQQCTIEALAERVLAMAQRHAPVTFAFLRDCLGAALPAGYAQGDPDEMARMAGQCELSYQEQFRQLTKVMGHWMLPDTSKHQAAVTVFVGPEGGGKGSLTKVIQGLIGANAVSMRMEQLSAQEYVHALMGRLLTIFPDEKTVELKETRGAAQVIKSVATGDRLSFRTLFGAPITDAVLRTRFLLCCNTIPAMGDRAMLRRMLVFDFSRVPEPGKINDRLDAQMSTKGERVGQILWMLLGRLWLAQDRAKPFTQPHAGWLALDAFEQSVQQFDDFVSGDEACLEVTGSEHDITTAAEITALFNAWAQAGKRTSKAWESSTVMRELMLAIRRRWPLASQLIRRPQRAAKKGKGEDVEAQKGCGRRREYVGIRLLKEPSAFEADEQGRVATSGEYPWGG